MTRRSLDDRVGDGAFGNDADDVGGPRPSSPWKTMAAPARWRCDAEHQAQQIDVAANANDGFSSKAVDQPFGIVRIRARGRSEEGSGLRYALFLDHDGAKIVHVLAPGV